MTGGVARRAKMPKNLIMGGSLAFDPFNPVIGLAISIADLSPTHRIGGSIAFGVAVGGLGVWGLGEMRPDAFARPNSISMSAASRIWTGTVGVSRVN